MENDNRIKVPSQYNFSKFEDVFISEVNKFINESAKKYSSVIFDLQYVTWIDLMEAMCLPIAADEIQRESNKRCVPEFLFFTPLSTLVDMEVINNQPLQLFDPKRYEELIKEKEQIKKMRWEGGWFLQQRETVFYQFLVPWHLFRVLKEKGLVMKSSDPRMEGNEIRYDDKFLSKLYKLKDWGREDRYLELTSVLNKESVNNVTTLVKREMEKYLPEIAPAERDSFCKVIERVCENIEEHAYDQNDPFKTGLIAIRKIRGTKKGKEDKRIKEAPEHFKEFFRLNIDTDIFELIIVDGGKGIYGTLYSVYKKEKGELMTDGKWRVLEYAFEKGKTCNPNKDYEKGLGLFYVKEDVNRWEGFIDVRSGDSRITFVPWAEEPKLPKKKPNWFPGTQIRILIPTKKFQKIKG